MYEITTYTKRFPVYKGLHQHVTKFKHGFLANVSWTIFFLKQVSTFFNFCKLEIYPFYVESSIFVGFVVAKNLIFEKQIINSFFTNIKLFLQIFLESECIFTKMFLLIFRLYSYFLLEDVWLLSHILVYFDQVKIFFLIFCKLLYIY